MFSPFVILFNCTEVIKWKRIKPEIYFYYILICHNFCRCRISYAQLRAQHRTPMVTVTFSFFFFKFFFDLVDGPDHRHRLQNSRFPYIFRYFFSVLSLPAKGRLKELKRVYSFRLSAFCLFRQYFVMINRNKAIKYWTNPCGSNDTTKFHGEKLFLFSTCLFHCWLQTAQLSLTQNYIQKCT